MNAFRRVSSSTSAPKFTASCAAALSLAAIGLFATAPNTYTTTTTPSNQHITVLPTIVVVPDAADRAAAAALQTADVQSPKRIDEV
jgi:hypothetical protein